jgi:hypothetical protein
VGRWRSANLDYTAARTMDLCMRSLLEKLGYDVDPMHSDTSLTPEEERSDGKRVPQLT